jgi:hypothetical protein
LNRRRRLKIVAVAASLAVHAIWLIVLTSVHPGPSVIWDTEFEPPPPPPVEVDLTPQSASGLRGAAAPAAGSALAAGLRTLDAPSAAQPAPALPTTQAGPATPAAPPRFEPAPNLALAPSANDAGLRAAAAAEPSNLPTLALRPPVDAVSPITAAAKPAVPRFVPPPTLALAEPEPAPPPTLAARPSVQFANTVPAAKPAPRPELRQAQALPETAPPTVAPRPPVQLANSVPALKTGPRPELRPAEGPTLPETAPPTLAPRPSVQQAAAVPAATRPAAPSQLLRPSQSLALSAPADGAQAQAATAPTGQNRAATAAGPGQAVTGATAGQGAGRHPGCEPEDLILLTPAEKERCRNQIDAFNTRLANARAADEAARRVHLAESSYRFSGIPPDKRAYYDAVVAANDAVHNTVGGGKPPGLSCNFASLFGGTPGTTSAKIKIPGLPCVFTPPVGVLTEETRLTPP